MVLLEEIEDQNEKAQPNSAGAGSGRVNSLRQSGVGGKGETVEYVNDGGSDSTNAV